MYFPEIYRRQQNFFVVDKCDMCFEGNLQEKNGIFTVRLTVRVYPPPPLWSAFREFFGVCLTLDYDYICSETDFTHPAPMPTATLQDSRGLTP